jgi:nucleotide-binding universal stress UspA family protein
MQDFNLRRFFMATNRQTGLQKNSIFWAIDPLQNPENAKNILKELELWAKKSNCQIKPVCIFSNRILNFPLDLSAPEKNESAQRIHRVALQYLKKVGAKEFLEPEIIFVKESSRRKKAEALAKFAEAEKALMIFAGTHAKPGRMPMRLGGFAETLLGFSKVPVLLMNSSAKPSAKIPAILFPTNFSRESKNALSWIEPWAKTFQSKILLFNQLEGVTDYQATLAAYGEPANFDWNTLMKKVEAVRIRRAHAWKEACNLKGLSCETFIQKQKGTLAKDILAVAKKENVGLIALASLRGPFSRFFLGSTARDVLVGATCPVIVCYRPNAPATVALKTKTVSERATANPQKTGPTAEIYHG